MHPWITGVDQDDDRQWLQVESPLTGRPVARLACCTPSDVDAAVAGARAAFPGWSGTSPRERARVLREIVRAITEDLNALIELEVQETGKPPGNARGSLTAAVDYFEYYAALVRDLHGETFPVGESIHAYSRREALGPVAVITPWNGPLNQAARGVAPALAAGNTVVLKPSEFTSSTSVRLGELAVRAGLPDGALSVLTGRGPDVGARLVDRPDIRRVAFTGSVVTGRAVAVAAARRLIPVGLELGGKSPHLVFADADLSAAADSVVAAFTANSGQVCSAGTRLYVASEIAEEFVDLVVESASARRPRAELGPLMTRDQYIKVREHFADAERDGAVCRLGGQVDPGGEGWYVPPTVYTGVRPSMRVAREEVFGPVLSVFTFDDEDDVVAAANDTPYGLAAGFWTGDLTRAHRVAAALRAGQVYVNGWSAPLEVPFGGYKDSGFGREKGRQAMEENTQTKSVIVHLGR